MFKYSSFFKLPTISSDSLGDQVFKALKKQTNDSKNYLLKNTNKNVKQNQQLEVVNPYFSIQKSKSPKIIKQPHFLKTTKNNQCYKIKTQYFEYNNTCSKIQSPINNNCFLSYTVPSQRNKSIKNTMYRPNFTNKNTQQIQKKVNLGKIKSKLKNKLKLKINYHSNHKQTINKLTQHLQNKIASKDQQNIKCQNYIQYINNQKNLSIQNHNNNYILINNKQNLHKLINGEMKSLINFKQSFQKEKTNQNNSQDLIIMKKSLYNLNQLYNQLVTSQNSQLKNEKILFVKQLIDKFSFRIIQAQNSKKKYTRNSNKCGSIRSSQSRFQQFNAWNNQNQLQESQISNYIQQMQHTNNQNSKIEKIQKQRNQILQTQDNQYLIKNKNKINIDIQFKKTLSKQQIRQYESSFNLGRQQRRNHFSSLRNNIGVNNTFLLSQLKKNNLQEYNCKKYIQEKILKFLKKNEFLIEQIEASLKNSQINQFLIKKNQSLITKKRKLKRLKSINQALKNSQLNSSLQQYIQIYQLYCLQYYNWKQRKGIDFNYNISNTIENLGNNFDQTKQIVLEQNGMKFYDIKHYNPIKTQVQKKIIQIQCYTSQNKKQDKPNNFLYNNLNKSIIDQNLCQKQLSSIIKNTKQALNKTQRIFYKEIQKQKKTQQSCKLNSNDDKIKEIFRYTLRKYPKKMNQFNSGLAKPLNLYYKCF